MALFHQVIRPVIITNFVGLYIFPENIVINNIIVSVVLIPCQVTDAKYNDVIMQEHLFKKQLSLNSQEKYKIRIEMRKQNIEHLA